ncbi:PTS system trehalose-specific EIIBC component [Robinsoniella peoriensis]|uniref:EIIBC-Tre n=1 Tax=Robinsoniella peoriensis TaxID=180332 RepID=A0A4V6HS94_9FIRM|nr:PTS system trehalose-specific EIIBC component [Robinsoniella peoriensis]MDU7030467.1 PTS system trehalose-specific EIIBC component [Clostridiales bacterium]TLD02068.1 EIIBC-Tre [Robinsoniella peoriensis]
MANYTDDVKKLLELIGGRDNIQAVSHCMTRMRFVLIDQEKADEKQIEKIPSVKGTFTQAGQYQVIIGNDVSGFYNEFTKYAGIEGVSKDQVKQEAKKKQNPLQKGVSNLAEIFAPLIPAIIVGGLILGFRNIIGDVKFLEGGTKTLTDVSVFWSGIYSFLWLIGEAVFHFLPVGIVWSVTKKMGTTQILGIVLGITLVSPQLLNAYEVGQAAMKYWDFGFFQMQMAGYQGQVIPAILAGFTLVYLERFFKKITPAAISMIVVPFMSLLLSVIVAHGILGPIGWQLGSWISAGVYAGLTSSFRGLFGAFFGFIYAPLVITGLHHMTNAIDLQLIADYQGTILWPMIALSNIAQGSAVLAMIVLQKKNERAQQVAIPACISCYLGVTEPAIFGVNLKAGFPFISGMIGSGIAGALAVSTGVMANAVGVGGIPGILSIKTEFMAVFAICMLIVLVVPFVLTWIMGKKKLTLQERGIAAAEVDTAKEVEAAAPSKKEQILMSVLTGKIIPIEEVPDDVFSQKIMGEGIGIEPESETVVAPANGSVSAVMEDSGHACGLVLENGMEILIHVGIDTVDMNGEGFELFVKEGDTVRCGDPLIRFSKEKIKKACHPATTVFIVTDEGNASNIRFLSNLQAEAGETVIAAYE